MATESLFGGRVEPIQLEDEIQRSYLDYAMSVIVGRALPDVRDGLKPVQRRILWSMMESGLRPDRPHRKSVSAVGEVLKKYHPHGDSSVYDALVRLAQDWVMRAPLIDGHGNFGSVDGDPAAAYRYTEARLAPAAMELLRDIDADTVNFAPNFDGYEQEPLTLPARFPNLLVNGAAGIAVGMATNIPPHNMGEVIDAVCAMIDEPDIDVAGLMKHVLGPDFPTGAQIIGSQGINDAYLTGRGSIKVRAVAEVEEGSNNRMRIVVSELPYQVNKARLAEKIAELVRTGKLKDIADLKDESNREGMRLVVDLKRGANAQVVLNQLYKHTQLQESFGVIMLSLVDNVPKVLNLAEMIGYYLDHQIDVVTRRAKFELKKAEDRDHIVQGLLIALDNLDAVIKVIRGSQDAEQARQKLMNQFKLSEIQANHILDMPLRRLTKLAKTELEQEHKDLVERIKYLKGLLKDPVKIRAVIKEELLETRKKFANARRTQIRPEEGEFDVLDLIPEEDVIVTVSRAGYIKRQPLEAFRRQGRGGKGVRGATLKEEDVIKNAFTTTTHHWLLIFTTRGKVYRVKVHEVPDSSRTARGLFAANLPGVVVTQDERISAVIDLKEYTPNRYLVFATKKGMVKKTSLAEYDSPRTGLAAINLKEGDELIDVFMTGGKDDIFMVSHNGSAIRFKEETARPMGRSTAGVIGMRLREGDDVLAVGQSSSGVELISVTENGYGKRTDLKHYPRKGRGGLGVVGHKLTKKTGRLAGAFIGSKDQDVFLVSSSGIVIRVPAEQIRRVGRASQGVRTMRVEEGANVVAMAPVVTKEEEDLAAVAGGDTPAGQSPPNPRLRAASGQSKAKPSSAKKPAPPRKVAAKKKATAKKPAAKKPLVKKKAVTKKKTVAKKRTAAKARGGTSRKSPRRR